MADKQMADDPIVLAPPDPRWPALFAAERDAIAAALAPWLTGTPEHIGSTAVPGLAAKPILDIMAPVASLDAARGAVDAAAQLGYVHFPYRPDQMLWFCKPGPVHRTHHLHLVPARSALWRERLAFRDALRRDDRLRAAYGALKARLAAAHPHDREAYTDAKTPFVEAVLASAGATSR